MTRKTTTCKYCGAVVALTTRGLLRKHQRPTTRFTRAVGGPDTVECGGSGEPPVGAPPRR